MNENQLFAFIKNIVDAGLTANGISAELARNYQPTRQGQPLLISVFMERISDHRYGWKKVDEVWDEDSDGFVRTETQNVETLFQLGCISKVDPANVDQLSAVDILTKLAGWLSREESIEAFHAANMGIQRITDVRNPKFVSDTDQFQNSPSFDFTITHKQSTISSAPKVSKFEPAVYPI